MWLYVGCICFAVRPFLVTTRTQLTVADTEVSAGFSRGHSVEAQTIMIVANFGTKHTSGVANNGGAEVKKNIFMHVCGLGKESAAWTAVGGDHFRELIGRSNAGVRRQSSRDFDGCCTGLKWIAVQSI